jgi:Phosphotransferase enzyme family
MHLDDHDPAEEVPLEGGDVTEGVVRVGDTVRRPQGVKAPVIHRLLRHLEAVGFDGAPRFLGVDGHGRETLTYVHGEVAGRPRPPWIADESRLLSVARLVRRYDDAAATFGVPDEDVLAIPQLPHLPPLPERGPAILAHMDITPENVVFRDGEAFALIDFDLLQAAPRVDEVINALLWWADFQDPVDRDPAMRDVDTVRRCALFVDEYGLDAAARAVLVETAQIRRQRSWHLMQHNATTLGGGWARMWNDGVGDVIVRGQRFLDAHAGAINRAIGV